MKHIILILVAIIAAFSASAEVKELHDFWDIKDNGRPIVIDAYASWCAPCRAYKPIFDKLAREFQGRVDFYRVDIDNPDSEPFVERCAPQSVPTTYFLWDPLGDHSYKQREESGFMSYDELKAHISATIQAHTSSSTD